MREDLMKKRDELIASLPNEYQPKVAELLGLQAQLDVVPVEVMVPEDEVVCRYKIAEGVEIVKCRTCIVFRHSNMSMVVNPTMAKDGGSLYSTLKWFCDYQESDKKDEDLDNYCLVIVHLLSLPVDLFYDIPFCVDIAGYVFKKQSECYEALLNRLNKETEEDVMANDQFASDIRDAEEFNEAMKEMARKTRRLRPSRFRGSSRMCPKRG